MDIPVITGLSIEEFSAGNIVIPASMVTNCVYGKRPNGKVFATQRPSINIFENASETVTDAIGRGNYYWGDASALYFVNGATVYSGSYANPLAEKISGGFERVEFFVVGNYLVILDAENNEGWTIERGNPTVLVPISDLGFPPNQTPALGIAHGGAEMNSKLYVYCTNGEIFESDVEDPTTWGLLNFIKSEVRSDDGVMCFKHADHIIALGARSMQFFYDNANPTGSTLNTRQDITHDIGSVDHNTYYGDADASYFVGQTESGDVGVYLLSNFSLSKISGPDLDSMLTSAIVTDGVKVVASGFSAGGRGFYVLTFYNINESIFNPQTTIVYDSSTGFWNPWRVNHDGIQEFPLIDWTRATGTRAGTGILSNGDIVTVYDDFNPQDSIEAQVYVDPDYWEVGYITDTLASGKNIFIELITGSGNFGTLEDKRMDRLRVEVTPTKNPQQVIIQWSDEGNDNWGIGHVIDISNPKNKINRCGKFKNRNFKISYFGDEQIELEGLTVNIL